ncbi:MAG: hypothetical protein J5563_07935 [Clostridia bacterium]|nr:hypothetical protein [Clostridia bacterium]
MIYCISGESYDYSLTNSIDCLKNYSSNLYAFLESVDREGESGEVDRSVNSYVTYNVHGYIRWKDSNGILHPASNVTVNIYSTESTISNGYIIGSATTDSNGYYSVNVQNSGTEDNVFIRVQSSGLNVTVRNASNVIYSYTSMIYNGVTNGNSVSISYNANNSTDLGKSMCVHQSFELANRYMYSLENTYMNSINISFPDNSHGTTCYYNNKIYVLSGDAFDWDVLEHEYGHYVADVFNILANVGGSHYLNEILALTKGKSNGIKLAWNEGWATYFAINLQNKMGASSMNIPNVGDECYSDTDDANIYYSIESVDSDYLLGESGEVAVSGILYDITDPTNSSDNDEIYCSNSNIWYIIKNNTCQTLSSFVTSFYNSSFTTQTKLKLGKTLSHFKVAALLSSTVNIAYGSNPTFSWVKQGGSVNYQNGSFSLAFYDSSYNLILKTSSTTESSQTLTTVQWNQIKNSGSTVYCCVETYQTTAPTTGPYYSNRISISTS